jgi:hypothetical protein
VEEGPMMANTELREGWISSGKANSVSGKANQVTRVFQTFQFLLTKLSLVSMTSLYSNHRNTIIFSETLIF